MPGQRRSQGSSISDNDPSRQKAAAAKGSIWRPFPFVRDQSLLDIFVFTRLCIRVASCGRQMPRRTYALSCHFVRYADVLWIWSPSPSQQYSCSSPNQIPNVSVTYVSVTVDCSWRCLGYGFTVSWNHTATKTTRSSGDVVLERQKSAPGKLGRCHLILSTLLCCR